MDTFVGFIQVAYFLRLCFYSTIIVTSIIAERELHLSLSMNNITEMSYRFGEHRLTGYAKIFVICSAVSCT